MKSIGWLVRALWAVLLALWLGVLVMLATAIVLFFAGLIIPKVTVRTILEGWWWTALGLSGGFALWCVARGKLGRVLRRTSLKVYGWSSLFAVSLIVLFYVVERWRGHHVWQALDLQGAEQSLALTELRPPSVAASDNFAAIPLVVSWWEALPAADREGLRRLSDPVPGDAAGAWELQRPADLGACLEHYLPSVAPGGEVTAGQFLEAWRVFEPDLEQLQAAAERPYARFDLPYDRGMFDVSLGSKLTWFRAVGEALRLRAVGELAGGDAARALADMETMFRISELARQEPLLDRQRLALLRGAIQPIWEGLRAEAWSSAQLASLQARLSGVELLEEHREAVRMEMLLLIDLTEKLFPVRSQIPPVDLTEEVPGRLMLAGARWIHPTGWRLQNQAGLFQLGQAVGDYTVTPNEHRVHPDSLREIERDWAYHPPSLDPLFAIFIMPRAGATVADATERYAFSQVAVDLAATACAIEQYRLTRRQLPESLSQLVPDWLDRIPVDVIDGRPLRYERLAGNRYVLYSVGWNQIDDGGRVGETEGRQLSWDRLPDMRERGDWVWRLEEH
jgi:hypothetical protein